MTPPVWVLLITCHSPGSMPSANTAELLKGHAPAIPKAADAASR
jgi:hypothetical protein